MAARGGSTAAQEAAEQMGLAALVFMTEDADRLGHFLSETGFSPAELSSAAGSPETLAAVLDHMLSDESMLMVFAASTGIDPGEIGPARAQLPGGDPAAQQFAANHNTSGNTSGRMQPKRASKRWPGPGV